MKNRYHRFQILPFFLIAICIGPLYQAPLMAQAPQPAHWLIQCSGKITTWNVVQPGNYSITAYGAQGGPSNAGKGGLGAVVGGTFLFSSVGQSLTILVGQSGATSGWGGGGGGGGSFVTWQPDPNSLLQPLVVAGGGGGAGGTYITTSDGVFTTSGGAAGDGTPGGINGGGGSANTEKSDGTYQGGGGGGGFYSAGASQPDNKAGGGQSFLAGGAGGISHDNDGYYGGFGGGGAGRLVASGDNKSGSGCGGGGGGYSGGGASGGSADASGGGGGSILAASASNPTWSVGATPFGSLDGAVYISYLDAACTWTGAVDNSWDNSANWNYPFESEYLVYFAGANNTAVDTNGGQSVSGIVFESGAAPFTIGNGTLDLRGSVINQSDTTQTFTAGISFAMDSEFNAYSGDLSFSGPLSFGGDATGLIVSGLYSTLITGNIEGTGNLTVSGNLTLAGTNAFHGNVQINSGSLAIQGGAAIPDDSVVTINGGMFSVDTSETIGSLQGGGTTVINHWNTILTIAQTGNATYGGAINGAGGLGLSGNGTLILSGINSYQGGTTLQSGTLVLGGNHAAGIGGVYQPTNTSGSLLQIDTTGTIANNMTVYNLLVTENATLSGTVYVQDQTFMNVQSGAALTLSGSLGEAEGFSALTKTGNGTLALIGDTPFDGQIHVESGTLIGSSTTLSGLSQNNGAVEFLQNTNGTVSNGISGTGSLTKSGSGTLTLSGVNSYLGATTVAYGTLASGDLPNSTLILQPGAAYSPGADGGIATVSVGGITLNGGDLLYDLGNATSDRINSSGTAALSGPVVFEFSDLGYSAGSFTLLTGNGVASFNTANLSYNAVGNFSVTGNFVVSGNSLLFQTAASDAYTWDGGAGNGSWNTAANWVGDQVPPAWKTIHFAGSIQPNVDTNTDQSVLGIVFDENAVSFTINSTSNNTINLAGNIENDSPNDQTINCNINLVNNTVIAADAGRLALGGLISFGENSKFLAISGANATDITGNISGNGSLLKRGTGTLTLSGTNAFTGNTLINAGNLILEGGAALHDSGIVKLAASGATLTVEDSETIGSLQGGGTTAIHAGQTLTIAETGNATYAGAITGAGALTKTGAGTLIISGSNNHTGGTTLSGGTLQLLHANALGGSGLLMSSGTCVYANAPNSGGLFVPGHITWASSNAVVSMASTGNITTAGNFTHGGNVGNRTFDFGSGQYLQLGNNTLVNFGATTFNATNFQATYSPGTTLSGSFQIVGNSLVYVLQGGSASGSVIDGGTQAWMDFTVNGSATTATGNNTIRSLAFTNNGNLAIQAGHSLTLSQGQVAVENGSSVVSGGTLATPGNFNKTGAGELDVQSSMVVGGTASVDAGLLSVNGQLIANSVVVNPNATLGGAGLIVGNVNVNGNLSPGNSPGTLSIAGNLALTGANSTIIEIASPTNFDRIVVSGSANLGGALDIIPYNGNPLAYGQQYAFLTATGGIAGEFDTITAPETFRGRFLNLGTTGVLLIAPDTYTRVAVTPNQRQVAKALDSFIPATSGDRETISIALDSLTTGQYPAAFEQIMPGFYESLANIAIEQTYNQAQILTQRMGSLRLGAAGFQAIGMSQPIKYDKDGKSASDAKTASPIVEAPADTNWNSWVIANGEFSLSRGLSGVPNYNNNAGGFLVGADYRLSENFAAGLFAGYEYSYAKYDGGSSTAGNSALFGLYGSYTHEDGYYADAIVSGGYTGFQTRRSIEFSTIDRTASADPNSGQFSAALNLGKDFEIGKFTLGPIVGAQYTYAGIGGFTETGADSLDLALGQQNANSLRTNLGARLAYNWEVGANITLIPEVRGFWMHEFLNNPRNISSALDGGSGPSFDYETSAPYRNSVFGGAGISGKFADRWSASVFYNVNFGAENYINNIISTSLGFAF